MKPGDVFNPWRNACGFYPPDEISSLKDVYVLKTRRKLATAHKGLYILLVRRSGKNQRCFPGQEQLAKALGLSQRSIGRLLRDLKEFGLIRRRRRGRGPGGGGRSNEYEFLWHAIFERSKPALMTGQHGNYDRPRSSGVYKEESCTSETYTREARQHHQADDVACSPEERKPFKFAGLRKTTGNLKTLRRWVSAGIRIEHILGGIALGRLRHIRNPALAPIASMRYFENSIRDAQENYAPQHLEHTIRTLERELSRSGLEGVPSDTRPESRVSENRGQKRTNADSMRSFDGGFDAAGD